MKDTPSAPAAPRALLIPLDDREALLALRDFERPGPDGAGAVAATAGRGAEARAPKAA